MKALVISAINAPRPGYEFDEYEKEFGIVRDGTQVWKDAKYEIREIAIPGISDDEVLIKVRACGICGSDVHTYMKDEEGYIKFAWFTKFPNTPGHELAGEIVDVGKNVKDLKIGDPVTVEEMWYCGVCDACRTYHFNQCKNLKEPGSTVPGGMAEYMKAPAKYVWKINSIIERYGENVGFEIGALVEPSAISYHGTIIKSGGIKPGQYGAVFGTGPIGLGCVALMKQAGMSKIFAFEINETRRELAKKFGATHVFNPLELSKEGKKSTDVIMEYTEGWGCDLQMECAGKPHVLFPEMDNNVAFGGRIVNIAHSPQNVNVPVNIAIHMFRGSGVMGSNGSAGDSIFKHVINTLSTGAVDYTNLITGRFSLDDTLKAIEIT
jgi:threonine dehydrogenase-like Zn-dependent dehydrogenase